MPTDGISNNNSNKDNPLGDKKQKLVSEIRDSLAFGEIKNKDGREVKENSVVKGAVKNVVKNALKSDAKNEVRNEKKSEQKEASKSKLKDESLANAHQAHKARKARLDPKQTYIFSHDATRRPLGFGSSETAEQQTYRKITQVEYQDAIRQYQKNRLAARREAVKNQDNTPDYTETDYIRLKKEARDAVQTPQFRALRAHLTTFIVINSFLWFKLFSLFRGKEWQEKTYKVLLKTNARRIYNTIIKIQGLFIKFGQLVSVVSFAVPEEFREELAALQDKVPQRSVENIIKRIESDLGRPIGRVFSHFNAQALASASLAQVHEATLVTGERVAVKVQHIGIEDEVKADLRTFNQIVKTVDFFFNVRGLKRGQEQVTVAILHELDYKREAQHLETFAKNFSDEKFIYVPKIYRKYCSEHVLVMEYVDGIKANDYKMLDSLGIDRKVVARRIVEAFCQMVFKDGLIHGDPHPGNILVNEDTSITLVDFGAVVELSPILRQGIIDLVYGGVSRNTRKIMSGLRKVKYLTPSADDGMIEKIIEYIYEFILEGGLKLDNFSLNDIKFNQDIALMILKDMHHLDISYQELKDSFQLPEDVMMMGRMLVMLGGLCYEIDPQLKPFDVIRPYLQRFIFSGSGDWKQTVQNNVLSVGMGALQTIDNARYVIDKAKRGDLQFNVKDERKRRFLNYYLFQQFVSMFMATGAGIMTCYIWLQGDVLATQLGALLTGFFLWSAARAVRKAKDYRR